MSVFVDNLRSEIARLESQLGQARALLEFYEGSSAAREGPRSRAANGAARPRPFQSKGNDSKEQKIRVAVRELLGQRGGSLHRTEILAHVKSLGLMGQERDPLKSLGVYLNHFKDEMSPQGAGKWRLNEAK